MTAAALRGGCGCWTLGQHHRGSWSPVTSILSSHLPQGLAKLTPPIRPSLLAQCISPGLVETQFAFRLHDKEPEIAAATYEHIKVGLPSGPGKGTQSLSEDKGHPGLQSPPFRPVCHSSVQFVTPPGGSGWECGCWRGPQRWERTRVHSFLVSTLSPGTLSVSNQRMWLRLSSMSSAAPHMSR